MQYATTVNEEVALPVLEGTLEWLYHLDPAMTKQHWYDNTKQRKQKDSHHAWLDSAIKCPRN